MYYATPVCVMLWLTIWYFVVKPTRTQ